MENASKALLMAAGVLIGMLVISLAVYLFISFGSTSAEIHKQNEEQQIAQFNSQFVSYEEKRCTIYDVVTVANLATENNIYYELNKPTEGKDNYISVEIQGASSAEITTVGRGNNIEGNSDETVDYNKIIQQDIQQMKNIIDTDNEEKKVLREYTIEASISPTTQRVYKVVCALKQTKNQ